MDREDIISGLESIKGQGKTYFTSRDLADAIDRDVSEGEISWVGARLSEMVQERDDLELWNDGSNRKIWKVQV